MGSPTERPSDPPRITREQYGCAYKEGFRRTQRFLRSLGADSGGAEEIAQAAWVRGWERLHQLRYSSRIVEWVNSIAWNLHRTALRRDSRIEKWNVERLDRSVAGGTSRTNVETLLDCCNARQREVVRAVYLEEMSCSEAAAQFEMSVGAVHSELSRARKAVRRKVNLTPSRAGGRQRRNSEARQEKYEPSPTTRRERTPVETDARGYSRRSPESDRVRSQDRASVA